MKVEILGLEKGLTFYLTSANLRWDSLTIEEAGMAYEEKHKCLVS